MPGDGGEASRAPPAGPAVDSLFKRRKRKTRRGKSRLMRAAVYTRGAAANHAPYNDNRFLMEEHIPHNYRVPMMPRTRDSSLSVDSDDDYFYPLTADEEDFLTKEFSSVYEDAQSERLMGMSKTELMQEYLALQTRCEMLTSLRRDNDAQAKLREQEALVEELRLANRNLKAELERCRAASKTAATSSSRDSESDSTSTTTPEDAGQDSPDCGV